MMMMMMMIRGRDGRTNFILRIKEQETRQTLQEHDDDDDDDDDEVFKHVVDRCLVSTVLFHQQIGKMRGSLRHICLISS